MSTELSDEQLKELERRTFYLLLENEYTKEGDVAPTSLACGPVLYAQSEGMFAVKDSDTLRPFDISPLLSTIQSLRTELAAAKEEAKKSYQKGVDSTYATNQQLLRDAHFARSEANAALSILKATKLSTQPPTKGEESHE